jgi:hypothetical protein
VSDIDAQLVNMIADAIPMGSSNPKILAQAIVVAINIETTRIRLEMRMEMLNDLKDILGHKK